MYIFNIYIFTSNRRTESSVVHGLERTCMLYATHPLRLVTYNSNIFKGMDLAIPTSINKTYYFIRDVIRFC